MDLPSASHGTRRRPGFLLGLALGGVVTVFVGGYVAGERQRSPGGSVGVDAAPVFERRNPDAPAWEPTEAYRLPTVGSIFRNRLATAASPLEGFEAALLSPRAEECTDTCPLALRMVGGERATAMIDQVLDSLGPNLDGLASAPGVPPGLAAWLREAQATFRAHVGRAPAVESSAPLRGLFISMPRPDIGPSTWSVGMALYDALDAQFDRVGVVPRGGRRLLISRVEQASDGGGFPRLVMGAAEIGRTTAGRNLREIPAVGAELGSVYGSLWAHFGGLPDEIAGLYLTRDGTVLAYGPDLQMYRLPQSLELAKALRALLRRA